MYKEQVCIGQNKAVKIITLPTCSYEGPFEGEDLHKGRFPKAESSMAGKIGDDYAYLH